jgi:hypothetical protein
MNYRKYTTCTSWKIRALRNKGCKDRIIPGQGSPRWLLWKQCHINILINTALVRISRDAGHMFVLHHSFQYLLAMMERTILRFPFNPHHTPVFYFYHRDCLSIKSFFFKIQQPPCHSYRSEALLHHPGVEAATCRTQWNDCCSTRQSLSGNNRKRAHAWHFMDTFRHAFPM